MSWLQKFHDLTSEANDTTDTSDTTCDNLSSSGGCVTSVGCVQGKPNDNAISGFGARPAPAGASTACSEERQTRAVETPIEYFPPPDDLPLPRKPDGGIGSCQPTIETVGQPGCKAIAVWHCCCRCVLPLQEGDEVVETTILAGMDEGARAWAHPRCLSGDVPPLDPLDDPAEIWARGEFDE